MKLYVDKDKLQEYTTKLVAKLKTIFATRSQIGSPLVAATAAEMTDTSRVYVYTGSETGYTAGNWYYNDGSAWVSGGVYNAVAVQTDTTLSVSGEAADAKATGDAVAAVQDSVDEVADTLSNVIVIGTENVSIDFSNVGSYKVSINTSNLWSANPSRVGYILKRRDGAKAIEITANSTANTIWTLLKTNDHAGQTTPNFCDGYSRQSLTMGTSITVQLPADCNYIFVQGTWDGTTINTPESFVYEIDYIDKKWEQPPIGLHTMPESKGVLNVIKRCRQLTDVVWTPAVDLPRLMLNNLTPPGSADYNLSQGTEKIGAFKAGVQYKGIPYGRCDFLDESPHDYGYTYSYAGIDVDIDTFVTAVQNPESVIAKESQSDLSHNRVIPYAAVCSALVCYALNVAYKNTENIPDIPGLNLISPIKVDGAYIPASTFKLGDILNYAGSHTVIITDIVTDSNGEVTQIEISEATQLGEANPDLVNEGLQDGGVCRRLGYDVADFFTRFMNYSLYRYYSIASVAYTPSKFVNVGDELNMARVNRLPCMPYMGEGFKYKSGKIPNSTIVLTCDDYAYLRVFKDGTEMAGSPFAVTPGQAYVDVGFSEAGSYEAFLCNMSGGANTAVTAKCHWTVV